MSFGGRGGKNFTYILTLDLYASFYYTHIIIVLFGHRENSSLQESDWDGSLTKRISSFW